MKFTKIVKAEDTNTLSYKESYKRRFDKFVDELEQLTLKYGISLHAIGGVRDLNGSTFNGYSKDYSSGDLEELN